jgi:hypothetical protein
MSGSRVSGLGSRERPLTPGPSPLVERGARRAGAICLCLATAVLGMLVVAAGAQAQTGAAGIAVSNEYLRIRVNPGPEEAGRFAVDTTGGDPSRAADDNQPLVYGSTVPWTSFTTLTIDGKPVLFGGPTTRRAGKGMTTGAMEEAPTTVQGRAVITTCRFGDIEVKQTLGFARNPTTRVEDAARVVYTVENHGTVAHRVGLRVVLDTMLGANDGAPLRAGDTAITTAARFSGEGVPEYWQAFDSLSAPAVISQGALRGEGLTPPNRMVMADWGRLADSAWDVDLPEGADFTRAGEEEQDTAVALYWDPLPVEPGKSRMYTTLYGVGGVSLSPAQISLGLTAPAEVDYQYGDTRSFGVTAYIENSGGFDAHGAACTLQLPKGLKLAKGEAAAPLGELKSKETRQVAWRVLPTGEASGPLQFAVSVTSENLEPNRVTRELVVNSPPQLEVGLTAPAALAVTKDNRYSPNPFDVKLAARNRGAQAGRNVVVTLEVPEGLALMNGEQATKVAPDLGPGERKEFAWKVRATGMPSGALSVVAKATAAGAKPAQAKQSVNVPELTPEIRVLPASQVVPLKTDDAPTVVPIDVVLVPARDMHETHVTLSYDPEILEPLYVSRGEAFVHEGRLLSPWSHGKVEPGQLVSVGGAREEAPALRAAEARLFRVVFMVKAAGKTGLVLESTTMSGPDGKAINHRTVAGEVTVRDMEEAQ